MPTSYDRLNHLDRSFLIYESGVSPMHVGGTATFEASALRRPDGGLDIARIRALIEARLALIPRYRQVVVTTPLGASIWIDDAHFNLDYHVRHTSLPRPGDDGQLKALSARVFSQAPHRAQPLWELGFVERVGRRRGEGGPARPGRVAQRRGARDGDRRRQPLPRSPGRERGRPRLPRDDAGERAFCRRARRARQPCLGMDGPPARRRERPAAA